ncbi:ethanolamine ammonia-lyase subunit EutC [Listeria monocytogenes]|uniref:ethanolamine ammonia-lyase subunit EutC n=1 Tax=Listeria monocytogenes TaxID=1639 RepID=UPI000E74E6B0|nr:ethanolamine ammonia-lyase subunit EutC [Listeria monocytogenes]EAC9862410.1 ethanolamine ammonia-lyase subunit EutC [Listeria monocytogenes]EAD0294175.1 ethanolamine ammonia-lyase subunit EutC [Listeria monocytogenes]EAD1138662.1 ethanolamine ammonia-lyase subunit EutC [Listeria monocytogenes]EAD1148779.1 ethanolamine ammonia-lyase subunit EutC [Listeria monocytogenes]EAD4558413.1 ethanolamine ammonia-lyase subunit EutC [Listeria monocytogenes]
MNEQELKQMIEGILTEMSGGKTTDTVAAVPTKSVVETVVTEGSIPDITEVDIKKQLLVPEPADCEGYLKMKQMTPARLGLWRAGPRYKTETILRFRADHAVAQDSVFSYVSEDLVKEMNFIPVNTKCQDKDEYLTRPDLGREFDDEMVEVIRANTTKNAKLQIVVGDGLSSAAIEANIKDILPSIKQGLKMYNLDFDNIIFVKHCRVPSMDKIGEITGADVVCLLVGERPGLVTAESMSAYIAYKPTVGMPEARRTVISNIHSGGTPPVEAGAYIAELIHNMLEKKCSGIDLK